MYSDLLEKRKKQALEGRELWLSLSEEYQLDAGKYVLVLPPDTTEYHEPALAHLEEFLKRKQAEHAVVLFVENTGAMKKEKIREYSPYIRDVKGISRDDYENLVRFYCLYEFTDHLIIASLEEPDGRLGKNMIGKKGLTVDELINVTLYD